MEIPKGWGGGGGGGGGANQKSLRGRGGINMFWNHTLMFQEHYC